MESIFEQMAALTKPKQSTLKQSDLDDIKKKMYLVLMAGDDMDLGDMGECEDAVNEVFNDWINENKILIVE